MGVYTNNCPAFMKMKVKDRAKIIQKANLCPYCLDHRVETDKNHEKECKPKQPRFSDRWNVIRQGVPSTLGSARLMQTIPIRRS